MLVIELLFCLPVRAQGTFSSRETSGVRPGPVISAKSGMCLLQCDVLLTTQGLPHGVSTGLGFAFHFCRSGLTAFGGSRTGHLPGCVLGHTGDASTRHGHHIHGSPKI